MVQAFPGGSPRGDKVGGKIKILDEKVDFLRLTHFKPLSQNNGIF